MSSLHNKKVQRFIKGKTIRSVRNLNMELPPRAVKITFTDGSAIKLTTVAFTPPSVTLYDDRKEIKF